MNKKIREAQTWLDLSEAADYLGVHFTTLRRWADAGKIACTRTPGGRRRFALRALDTFLQASTVGGPFETSLATFQPMHERAIDNARRSARRLMASDQWLSRLDDEQRLRLKGTGQRLMILLLQYNGHSEGGEAFLEEGKRIARDYGLICSSVGLNLPETVQVFLFFRRSILESIHETGYLSGSHDEEGMRLFQRTMDFMDGLLVDMVGSFPVRGSPGTS